MVKKEELKRFYKGKRVFVTGHTGFKGSWLCHMLLGLGAEVYGYSLDAPTEPSIFEITDLSSKVNSVIGDIRDYDSLKAAFDSAKPEIVFHLAAQPIVRESYKEPKYTYETNVLGTVNICECVRLSKSVKSFLNVTTDKVYENNDLETAFTEDMPLDGFDPYSNSKSCSELVTHSYKKSFFDKAGISVSTARAGNVIGGGDFAKDRIVPDCVRAAEKGEDIIIRNPYSVRPFQHVLEPLYIYLLIAKMQCENSAYQGYYNVGPDESDCITTGRLADIFCACYQNGLKWRNVSEENAPHEAGYLKLNNDKLKSTFGWKPIWNIETAIEKTVEWTKAYFNGEDMSAVCEEQINCFWESINV
ncbi:MAG: CDP-glucose 4,6-dehydratase [Eubacterium sp.]|nr:CDP-glucose 4,6-dehydratase [Eubacterium sp.]